MTTILVGNPTPSTAPVPSLRSAIRRIIGSFLAFFAFPVSFVLLCAVGVSTANLGGSCASGGPYQIAVECPETDGPFVAAAVILIFVAIFGYALAGGFGVSLLPVGWLVLFGGFGALFIVGFFAMGLSSGIIVGPVFLLMAIVPIGFMLLAAPRALFLGKVRASGAQYYENEKTYNSLLLINPAKAASLVKPRALDWALSLGVAAVAMTSGVFAALAIVAAVHAG
ncbi:hypothetical protein EYE40_11990 [Glaciihabitans arcticus]|uniref:Uncharacterized protein n=1 Tax=Glaciihabitans arcticus TaxID=2668039 RepID=A0A4Q9GTN9_9MICO|nr:hypothetical protein [Glaciihabitans arcticus]TBN58055.1 hypothetical protein EYE40_11990 [Glaciihabitans arcticus]